MGFLVDNAKELLYNQFTESGRLQFWQQAKTERFEDTWNATTYVLVMTNLTLAEGVWLDLLGKYIGFPRPFTPWPDDNIFTFRETQGAVSDPDLSFGDNAGNGGYWQSEYGAVTSTPVDDDIYRRWLTAKAISNVSSSTIPDIYDWVFGATEITCDITTDPDSRIITVTMDTPQPQATLGLLKKYAPIQASARIEVVNA